MSTIKADSVMSIINAVVDTKLPGVTESALRPHLNNLQMGVIVNKMNTWAVPIKTLIVEYATIIDQKFGLPNKAVSTVFFPLSMSLLTLYKHELLLDDKKIVANLRAIASILPRFAIQDKISPEAVGGYAARSRGLGLKLFNAFLGKDKPKTADFQPIAALLKVGQLDRKLVSTLLENQVNALETFKAFWKEALAIDSALVSSDCEEVVLLNKLAGKADFEAGEARALKSSLDNKAIKDPKIEQALVRKNLSYKDISTAGTGIDWSQKVKEINAKEIVTLAGLALPVDDPEALSRVMDKVVQQYNVTQPDVQQDIILANVTTIVLACLTYMRPVISRL